MQTLGSLIDQLTILNLKLWHREEIRHPESGFSDEERLSASDQITVLNRQRCTVIEEIDEYLRACLEEPARHKIFKQMKNYRKQKAPR